MLKRSPHSEMVIEDYKKSKEFIDVALDVMKEMITKYLQVQVDGIKAVGPKFLLVRWGHFVIS